MASIAAALMGVGLAGIVQAAPARADSSFDVTRFSNILASELTGRSVGFQYTVGLNTAAVASGAGGVARGPYDPQPAAMTPNTRASIASLSKFITAVAVLQQLDRRHILLTSPIGAYLPSDWTAPAEFRQITFQQLLTHKSGIQADNSSPSGPLQLDYTSLRSFAQRTTFCDHTTPVFPCLGVGGAYPSNAWYANGGTGQYENANFAYFRFIIPVLAGNPPPSDNGDDWAAAYVHDVQLNVLAPVGLSSATCATDGNSVLNYQFEPNGPTQPGWNLGDRTQTCGSEGWVLSTAEYDSFFRQALTGSAIPYSNWLPIPNSPNPNPTLGQVIEQTCIGFAQQTCNGSVAGHSYWAHGGYYPRTNVGEFNAVTVAFDTGLTVTVYINSPLAYPFDNPYPGGDSPAQAVIDAFTTTLAGPPTCSPQLSGGLNWDGSVSVSGSCFTPNTIALLTLRSAPWQLYELHVSSNGTVSGGPFPSNDGGCHPGTVIWGSDLYQGSGATGALSNSLSVDLGCTSQPSWTGGGTGAGSGGPACGPGSYPFRKCQPNYQ